MFEIKKLAIPCLFHRHRHSHFHAIFPSFSFSTPHFVFLMQKTLGIGENVISFFNCTEWIDWLRVADEIWECSSYVFIDTCRRLINQSFIYFLNIVGCPCFFLLLLFCLSWYPAKYQMLSHSHYPIKQLFVDVYILFKQTNERFSKIYYSLLSITHAVIRVCYTLYSS